MNGLKKTVAPTENRILVRVLKSKEEILPSGLIKPGINDTPFGKSSVVERGFVEGIGSKVDRNISLTCIVIFPDFTGTLVPSLEDAQYYYKIITDDDVWGIVIN